MAGYAYEVVSTLANSTRFTRKHATQEAAIAEFEDSRHGAEHAKVFRRLYAQDPDCPQDSAMCPCGPVGDWEIIRELF